MSVPFDQLTENVWVKVNVQTLQQEVTRYTSITPADLDTH
jgi:hypothetical protein